MYVQNVLLVCRLKPMSLHATCNQYISDLIHLNLMLHIIYLSIYPVRLNVSECN